MLEALSMIKKYHVTTVASDQGEGVPYEAAGPGTPDLCITRPILGFLEFL